jgi:hypothetical protein
MRFEAFCMHFSMPAEVLAQCTEPVRWAAKAARVTRMGLSFKALAMSPGLRGRCWTDVSQLPCAWAPGPANSTSPRSTFAAKFSRSSRIMRSGLDITSATTSPTLPPGGSA